MTGWQTVYNELLTLMPSATGLAATAIYDGPTTSENYPPQYVVIGDNLQGDAGSFTPDFSDVGVLTDEQGVVNCTFVARAGSGDLATLRTVLAGWVDNLRAAIVADKRLGVLPEGSYVNVARVDVAQAQTKNGPIVTNVVQFSYFTRF